MKNKGFNLIKLMIVIAIIGILATIAIPAFQQSSCKKNGGTWQRGTRETASGCIGANQPGNTPLAPETTVRPGAI